MKTIQLSVAAILCSWSCIAGEKSTLSLTIENDSFFGTDRYYTQGTRLQYLHKPNDLPAWIGAGLTNLSNLGMTVDRTRIGGAISQELYTPSRLRPGSLIPNDRPYAGWLHGSLILRRSGSFDPAPSLQVQDEIELNLGVVGPESFAEDTQKWWHSVWDYTQPQGWRNQLRTEPVFQIYLNRAFRFGVETETFWGLECIPHFKTALGSVYDYGEMGLTLRGGFNLPKDFTRSPLESYSAHPSSNPPSWSAYVFTGADARVVGHNMFLDGNNWRSSHNIEKELFVADLRLGGAIRWNYLEFVVSMVHRTREFKGQVADENFLSVTTQWHF